MLISRVVIVVDEISSWKDPPEVLVGSVYSSIDYRNNDPLTCCSGPRKFRTHALQAPLLSKAGIVGRAPGRGWNQ
jgi:hypothetical protein